jgi:hypothetical protein
MATANNKDHHLKITVGNIAVDKISSKMLEVLVTVSLSELWSPVTYHPVRRSVAQISQAITIDQRKEKWLGVLPLISIVVHWATA